MKPGIMLKTLLIRKKSHEGLKRGEDPLVPSWLFFRTLLEAKHTIY
jgi:hypothetical protein